MTQWSGFRGAVTGLWIIVFTVLAAAGDVGVARAQSRVPAMSRITYVRIDAARAGIAPGSVRADSDSIHRASSVGQHVKHAAIGAAIGLGTGAVIGAGIGFHYDRTGHGDATFPATPIIAVEGALIGVAAGLVVGAFIP